MEKKYDKSKSAFDSTESKVKQLNDKTKVSSAKVLEVFDGGVSH